MVEDFHDEIDALALDIERAIERNEEALNEYEPVSSPEQVTATGIEADAEELFA